MTSIKTQANQLSNIIRDPVDARISASNKQSGTATKWNKRMGNSMEI